MARAKCGAGEGLWLRADMQTGGRGRLGRQWQSPRGNLYCSTLVRPVASDPVPHTLAFVAALAVYDAIGPFVCDEDLILKWPNDVLLCGAKLCGMLLEAVDGAVVVGIGLNVLHAPDLPDRRTASLQEFAVRPIPDAATLLQDLVRHFDARLHQWRNWPLHSLWQAWTERSHPIGTPLSVALDNETVQGKFDGLGDDGALRLRLPNGTVKTIYAGDVSLIA